MPTWESSSISQPCATYGLFPNLPTCSTMSSLVTAFVRAASTTWPFAQPKTPEPS